jgi:hypothetical protein
MTSQDGKKRPLNSGPAPRARNRTVVLTPDLASKVRASVQGGVQDRGFSNLGEDDGFTRPFQGRAEVTSQPRGDNGRPSLSSRSAERSPGNEGNRGEGDHLLNSRSLAASSLDEVVVEPGNRTMNPGMVGTAQVQAVVQSSQASYSSRSPQSAPQQSSERLSSHGVNNAGGSGSMGRLPQQSGGGGNPGGDSQHGGSDGGVMKGWTGSTSVKGVAPLGVPSAGSGQTSMALLPRSISNRGGSVEVPMVPSSMLMGFMVSFDENPYGEAFEIREGRTIISSDLPMSGGTVLLIEDASVGSMHAVLKAESNGTLILLDQLSESGTFVRVQGGEEQQLSGDRAIIKHGDMVRFGSRSFKVSLLY